MLHFDRIQTALLNDVEKYWRTKLDDLHSKLIHEGQALMLSKASNTWLKAGQLDFYNYFEEIPIVASVIVRDVRENGISVGRTSDLVPVLVAGEHQRYAHVHLPHSELSLRMAVVGASRSAVHWRYAGILHVAKERRRDIRVKCSTPQAITVRRQHGPEWEATLRDFSATGLGNRNRGRLPGKPGDTLYCRFTMQHNKFDVTGCIQWKSDTPAASRIGLELATEYVSKQKLQYLVSQRQEKTRQQLQLRGTPDCLISD